MADINQMKAYFKDASDDEAKRAYEWATTAMEVRGLIQIPGTRKRRSNAGTPKSQAENAAPAAGDQLKLQEPQA